MAKKRVRNKGTTLTPKGAALVPIRIQLPRSIEIALRKRLGAKELEVYVVSVISRPLSELVA